MVLIHVTYLKKFASGHAKARKVSYRVEASEVLDRAAKIAAAGNAARLYVGGTSFGTDRQSWTWKREATH